jgi:hypothetical protein
MARSVKRRSHPRRVRTRSRSAMPKPPRASSSAPVSTACASRMSASQSSTVWSWPAAAATGPPVGRQGRSVTAVDAAPEMLAFARQRARDLPVEFIQTDVFALAAAAPLRNRVLRLLAHPCAPGPVRQLLVDGRDGPDTGRAGSASSTTATENARANVLSRPGDTGGLAPAWRRQRAPGGQGLLHAGSAYGQGWPSWAGRQTSARPAPRCLSGPLEGPATSSLDTMEWAPRLAVADTEAVALSLILYML